MRKQRAHGAKVSHEGYYGSVSDERELGYREWRDTRAKVSWPLWMIRARYINYCKSWRAQHGA